MTLRPPSAKDKTPGSSEIPVKKWRKFVKAAGQASTSPESLLKFVSEESLHRKRDRKSALTKSLNQDQWKEMRGQIKEAASQVTDTETRLVLTFAYSYQRCSFNRHFPVGEKTKEVKLRGLKEGQV